MIIRHDSLSSNINLSNIASLINSLLRSKKLKILNLEIVFTSATDKDLKATSLPIDGIKILEVVSPVLCCKNFEKFCNFIY